MELRTGQVVRLLHEYDDGWVSQVACIICDKMLMINRHSAFVLTDLSKESFPELVCLLVLSSPDHLSKPAPEGHQSTLRDDPAVLL